MGLRKSFSDSISPIDKPRIIGTTKLQLSALNSDDVSEIKELGDPFFSLDFSQNTYEGFTPLTAFSTAISTRISNDARRMEILQAKLVSPWVFTVNLQPKVKFPPIYVELSIDSYTQDDVLLFTGTEISRDIFISLEKSRVSGKKYIKDEWKNAFKKVTNKRNNRRKKRTSTTFEIPIREASKDSEDISKKHYSPSFFDLIKPLLLPPANIFSHDDSFLPPGKEPYAYQKKGIEKLINNQSFLLADEMGTGKTVMATLAMRILIRQGHIRRVLILCPVSVLRVWQEHVYDWSLGEIHSILVRGTKEKREIAWRQTFHIFITSYDTFSRDVKNGLLPEDKQDFDLAILDEAQNIKNQNTARFHNLKKVNFQRKWAITGTPLENKTDDVKSIFEFLLPGYIHKEEKDPNKIREYIKPYMLRRLKKDVLKELPPKTHQQLWLQLSNEQRKQYDRIWKYGVAELSELEKQGRISKPHIFALIGKLKQVCNFPQNGLKSPKATATVDMVEEIVASGEKVVIFSQYLHQGINKLESILNDYGVVKLTGKMGENQRNNAIESFRKNPNKPILLATIKSAGTGLTFTEASYVIHFDHWWNPAIMNQAEDRVHRVGQKKPVTIYELWTEDTIEERIYKLLEEKKWLAGSVIDSLAVPTESGEITTEDWLYKVLQISPKDKEGDDANGSFKPEISNRNWDANDLDDVRERLYQIDPTAFEKLVAKVFLHLGYPHVEHQGQTSDGGIDVLARGYSENKEQYAVIQCKRYKKNVSVHVAREMEGSLKALREQRGNYDKKYKGYLVTSSDFTTPCQKFASISGGTIELINGLALARYILMYGLKEML